MRIKNQDNLKAQGKLQSQKAPGALKAQKARRMLKGGAALAMLLLLFALLPVSVLAEKENPVEAALRDGAGIASASDASEGGSPAGGSVKVSDGSAAAVSGGGSFSGSGSSSGSAGGSGSAGISGLKDKLASPSNAALKAPEKKPEEELTGLWSVDGVTDYCFYEDRSGALILPDSEYTFTFTVKEEELILQFGGEIGKAAFTYSLEENSLVLNRLGGDSFAEVTLERIY